VGVEVETITPGDGETFPKQGDELTMHYVGTLMDETVFDSSRKKNRPFKFKIGLGMVIKVSVWHFVLNSIERQLNGRAGTRGS
jgi:FK506-binding protein 1